MLRDKYLFNKYFLIHKSEKYPDYGNSPIISCYHYALTTCDIYEVGGVILRRLKLIDSYVTDYNILLLKAFESNLILDTVNGNGVAKFYFREEVHDDDNSAAHQLTSLSECMVLFDNKLIRKGFKKDDNHDYFLWVGSVGGGGIFWNHKVKK